MEAFFRKIYQLNITLRSPLAIGSGANESTDRDVIVDASGAPLIPATSLAGVLRGYTAETRGVPVANAVFGYVPDSHEAKKRAAEKDPAFTERVCPVRVYDGLYSGGGKPFFITTRDMAALRDKVGIDGAKFDMEAVEPGACFTAYIELTKETVSYAEGPVTAYLPREIEAALSAMHAGLLRLGTKTTRGYGEVSLTVKEKTFTGVSDWLDFDMADDDAWQGAEETDLTAPEALTLRLGLRLRGGISVREYTTAPGTKGETMPDYRQLSLHTADRNGCPEPVIPGTSWAGAFRARYAEFAGEKETEALFGFVHQKKKDGDDKTQKARIVFSESRITGGVWKITTRNAIDRFSGGTKNGALYTEETYYGGSTELVISFPKEAGEIERSLLCACLADLHNGFLAVGGLTSVGRGLFAIESVNGRPLKPEESEPEAVYETLIREAGIDA